MKGYVYHDDARVHFTSLPLYLGASTSERMTFTFMYRFDLASDGFFPDSESFEDPRHTYTLGLEYCLQKPDPAKWNPRFAFGIGLLDSGDASPVMLLNAGFKFTSPYKKSPSIK